MALKTFLTMSLLLTAMPYPQAKAQLGILGGLDLINIHGFVPCPSDATMIRNGSSTKPFRYAEVQLECGGLTIFHTTTNDGGEFSLTISPLQLLLSWLLNGCSVIVATPLSNCDPALPSSGTLVSNLKYTGNSLLGKLLVANVVPSGFQLTPISNQIPN